MQKVVVSFADKSGNYKKSMQRLRDSFLQVGYDGDFKLYEDYDYINSPPHKLIKEDNDGSATQQRAPVPYAFKAHAIEKAIAEMNGEGILLWCDSPIYATKSIQPIFEQIKSQGYLFFDNIGYSIGDYTSDACLEKQGMSRQEAFDSKMLMACCMGFDLSNGKALEFLERYISSASDGISYMGDWDNKELQVSKDARVLGTRHDQSVASIIVKQMGLKITNAQQTYFAYTAHKGVLPIADSVCIWSGGM